MKTQLAIGPFFYADSRYSSKSTEQALPANFVIEWATSRKAYKIPIFKSPWAAPDRLGLHHLFIRESDIPCDLEIHDGQQPKNFVPLDAVLLAIHLHWHVARRIFDLLNELTSVSPLHHTVTNPIQDLNLLDPTIEARGFRLNTIIADEDQRLAQISWEAALGTRFHACMLGFTRTNPAVVCSGRWIPNRESGICQLLYNELGHHGLSEPMQVLSAAGQQLLKA